MLKSRTFPVLAAAIKMYQIPPNCIFKAIMPMVCYTFELPGDL